MGGTEQGGGETKILKRRTSWFKGWVPLKGGGGTVTPLQNKAGVEKEAGAGVCE